jgi:hypothetical protein
MLVSDMPPVFHEGGGVEGRAHTHTHTHTHSINHSHILMYTRSRTQIPTAKWCANALQASVEFLLVGAARRRARSME